MRTQTPVTVTPKMAREIAERTSDAYSFDRYASWPACALMLARRGFTAREIEAILRSKWTRWAGDEANKNDRVTSKDLARFLDTSFPSKKRFEQELADLVRGTFPFGGVE